MEQSVELQNLTNRFLESLVRGDVSFVEHLFSKKDCVLAIGSDPDEWWANYDTLIQGFRSQIGEVGGAQAIDLDTQAYCEGSVGWVANRFKVSMPDGSEIPFRVTGVFHQEDGEWQAVQWHTSIGISNEEIFGRLTTPALTGAQQTMASWAKVIESYSAVPEVYKNAFRKLVGDRPTFPYTVLTPPMAGFLRKTTEKLICEVNDVFYVLERAGRKIIAKAYPLGAMRDVEVGVILLHSWITLSGVTTDGEAASSTFEFSSATGGRLAPFLNKIRSAINGPDDTGLSAERAKFDNLASSSFKFMNYAKSSLMGSAKVLHTVWQPEIRAEGVLSGWPFYQTVSPAHLTILTDKELILIWDDERVSGNKRARYGGVWRYIPLRSIVSVSLAEQANDLLTFSIELSGNDRLDKVFAAAHKHALEQLQNEVKKLMG